MGDEFLWGAAISPHQTEGSPNSDWHRWENKYSQKLAESAERRFGDLDKWPEIKDEAQDPENYISKDGIGHRQRYDEDFKIAKEIGLNSFRTGIEWSRVQPGPDEFDEEEIKHYKDYFESMQDKNLEPMVTLWHFTNPDWVEDSYGGWHNDETVEKFCDYVEKMAEEFGDEVDYWITLNEPSGWIRPVYGLNDIIPVTPMNIPWPGAGLEDQKISFRPVKAFKAYQNLKKAHQNAYEIIHEHSDNAMVGTSNAIGTWRDPYDNLISRNIKQLVEHIEYGDWLESNIDHSDFIGVNHYAAIDLDPLDALNEATDLDFLPETDSNNYSKTDMGWPVDPTSLREVLENLSENKYIQERDIPLIVTEHGAADRDDEVRPEMISEAVDAVKDEDLNVKGYYHWSLFDNFEWDKGFWPRFGLVEIDYENNKERKLRGSARLYSNLIENSRQN